VVDHTAPGRSPNQVVADEAAVADLRAVVGANRLGWRRRSATGGATGGNTVVARADIPYAGFIVRWVMHAVATATCGAYFGGGLR
jgi:hypothetical protein